MEKRDGGSDVEQRGPAPSVSTPLLFLVMLSVVAAFSLVPVLVSPSDSPLKPWLAVLIPLPALFGWWFWAQHRQHPQLNFILMLAFFAVQFFFGVAQVTLFDNDPRRTPIFAQLATLTAGLAFSGGLIYLWFQMRKERKG